MLTLINNILDFSKVQASKLELSPSITAINAVMLKVLGLFTEKSKAKDIELHYKISKIVPSLILLDEGRFVQILINFVGNAIKFTEKGNVTVILHWKNLETPLNLSLIHI